MGITGITKRKTTMREEIADQIVELERKIAVLPEGSVSKKTNKKDHPQSGQPSPLQMVFFFPTIT